MKYIDKFKDPRWQKKRLEIMERAGFKCENCHSDKKTLNIHHGYYDKGYDPWDYNNETLWCLCEECHESVMGQLRDLHFQLAKIHPSVFYKVIGYLEKNKRKCHG